MSTQAQIDANRINSQKSSGPVTDAGKAASSQNRASHRLSQFAGFQVLDSEDKEQYQALLIELILQFGIRECEKDEAAIVSRMAQHEWMRRRALNYQDNMLQLEGGFRPGTFKLFMRYESQHERAYASCFNQLLKLRAEKRSEILGFERKRHLYQQVEERKQRHETVQKARQLDIECKIVRTLRTAANNPEALDLARKVQTRFQAA
jgi:hypothetical protein